MPLTHGCRRPPPDMPTPGIEPTTLRLRDLRLARLSEPGILVCDVCASYTLCGLLGACVVMVVCMVCTIYLGDGQEYANTERFQGSP